MTIPSADCLSPDLLRSLSVERPRRCQSRQDDPDILESLRRDVIRCFPEANLALADSATPGPSALPFVRVPPRRALPWMEGEREVDEFADGSLLHGAKKRWEALERLRGWLEEILPTDELALILRLVDEQFGRGALAREMVSNRNEVQRLLVDACLCVHRAALAEALVAGLRESPACAVEVSSLGTLEHQESLFAVPLAGAEQAFDRCSAALLRDWLEGQSARLIRERNRPVCLVGHWGGKGEPLLTAAVAHVESAGAVRTLARSLRRSWVIDLGTGEPVAVAEFPHAMAA